MIDGQQNTLAVVGYKILDDEEEIRETAEIIEPG